jgi:transmembrane sensor
MSIDKDLIHRLTLEELAQVISEEDLVYLKTNIRENPEAFQIWQETRRVLDTPDVKAFLAKPRPVENIFHAAQNPNRPGFWAYTLSIAGIIL